MVNMFEHRYLGSKIVERLQAMFISKKQKLAEKRLQDEVEFLRNLVKELTDKIMALSGSSFERYTNEKIKQFSVESKENKTHSAFDVVNGIEARTEEERAQKENALREVNQLLGAI